MQAITLQYQQEVPPDLLSKSSMELSISACDAIGENILFIIFTRKTQKSTHLHHHQNITPLPTNHRLRKSPDVDITWLLNFYKNK